MKSEFLDALYEKYEIASLPYGKIHDKLGDVYEEFCVRVLSDLHFLQMIKEHCTPDCLEFDVFKAILKGCGISEFSNLKEICATNVIPHRASRGLSKTDVIVTVKFVNGSEKKIAISCKQSYVSKIAFAEFDFDTICREVGISDVRLRDLMLKHQTEKSAKYFTPAQKNELRTRLEPIRDSFVRWVITGSPERDPLDLLFPTVLIKFKLKKPADRYNIHVDKGELQLQSFAVTTVEEYIYSVIHTKKGAVRSGGFGTGLSWTYATGSGGYKIQFKA